MNSAQLLTRYEDVWRLTQQMLDLAQRGDWDHLTALERERAAIVDQLARLEEEKIWGAVEGARKGYLIRAILEADAEIKALTESWMGELQEILGSIGTEKKLQTAYQSQ